MKKKDIWKVRNSRGFDGTGKHRNGTAYDDDGYDWLYRNKHGKVRKDQVPPYKGSYILGVIMAVQSALDWANDAVEDEDGTRPDCFSARVMLETEFCYESYGKGDNADPLGECWGSRGVLVITDEDHRHVSHFDISYTFWDEDTDAKLMDARNFSHALCQVGLAMLNATERDKKMNTPVGKYITRVARLLMLDDLWKEGADAWATMGLEPRRCRSAYDIKGWDTTLRKLKPVTQHKERTKRRERNYSGDLDDFFDEADPFEDELTF
jgi:hypothetical protein